MLPEVHSFEIIEGRARDSEGRVAVLISHGYGTGWYTWHGNEDMIYDPVIVRMLVNNVDYADILDYCERTYGKEEYYGGIDGLTVYWLEPGTRFYIEEYDGAEDLITEDKLRWMTV